MLSMEVLKLKAVVRDGNLLVPVPKELNDQEVEVIVLHNGSKDEERETRIERLMSIVGTAKYPDFPIDKYDVYNQ